MTIPKYCTRLTGDVLERKLISCTGQQLCKILRSLIKINVELTWYLADISTISKPKDWDVFTSNKPLLLGGADMLIERCSMVEQFTSGVFLGVSKKEAGYSWSNEYDTEDVAFIDNEIAEIEIRAFDTTYFEVYSSNLEVHEMLSQKYQVNVDKKIGVLDKNLNP